MFLSCACACCPQVSRRIHSEANISTLAHVAYELITNAIDAKADQVKISVDVSTFFIQVEDNGKGMSLEDLGEVGKAHTTSKLKTLEDLGCVNTLGFRGEALHAIADVSCLELVSQLKDHDCSMKTWVRGAVTSCQRSSGTQRPFTSGTTVTVRDLFGNMPVRQAAQLRGSYAGCTLGLSELDSIRREVTCCY